VSSIRATAPAGPAPVILSVPAEPESVSLVRQAVTGIADMLGMSPEGRDDLRIAVTEAATNVVVHAYRDRPGPMRVEVWTDTDRMVIHVTDHGCGIVPRVERVTPGLGLGIPLIAALSEEMSITANDDGSGTRVGMTFRIR
jgi:anti-sigma regulatory factor (Ser/Thr protein kinase)